MVDIFIEYLFIGIVANIISEIIMSLILATFMVNMNIFDLQKLIGFRRELYTTKTGKFLIKFEIFIPFYTLYINIVGIILIIKYTSEEFNPIELIRKLYTEMHKYKIFK